MPEKKEAYWFWGHQVKCQGHTMRFKVKPCGHVLSQNIGSKLFKFKIYLLCQWRKKPLWFSGQRSRSHYDIQGQTLWTRFKPKYWIKIIQIWNISFMSVKKEAYWFWGHQVKGQGHTIRFNVKPSGHVLSLNIGPK